MSDAVAKSMPLLSLDSSPVTSRSPYRPALAPCNVSIVLGNTLMFAAAWPRAIRYSRVKFHTNGMPCGWIASTIACPLNGSAAASPGRTTCTRAR